MPEAFSVEEIARLRNAGDKAAALAALRALNEGPARQVPAQALQIAREFRDLGAFDEAEQIYREILRQQPDHLWAAAGHLALQRHRGLLEESLAALQVLLRKWPKHLDLKLFAARELNALGRVQEGLDQVDAVLAAQPKHLEARLHKAQLLSESPQDALAIYRDIVADHPQNLVALMGMARIAESSGDGAQALDAIQRAIQCAPDAPRPHVELGLLLHRLGNESKSFEVLAGNAARFPEQWDAQMQAAHAARRMGYRAKALEWFTAAAALEPERQGMLIERARELLFLQRPAEAEAALAQLDSEFAKAGDAIDVRLRLAALQGHEVLQQAVEAALQSQTEPMNLMAVVQLAWRHGNHAQAVDHLRRAVQSSPDANPGLTLGLARTLVKFARFAAAASALKSIALPLEDRDQKLERAQLAFDLARADAKSLLQELVNDAIELSAQALPRVITLCHAIGMPALREQLFRTARPAIWNATNLAGQHAMLLQEDGDPVAADNELDAIARRNPEFPLAKWQAALMRRARDVRGARTAMNRHLSSTENLSLDDARTSIRILIEAEELGAAEEQLVRCEKIFAPRDLVLERSEILRLNLRFEEELGVLQSAVATDPASEMLAESLVECQIINDLIAEPMLVVEDWRARHPTSLTWIRLKLACARAVFTQWEPLLKVYDGLRPFVVLRARFEFVRDHVDLLMGARRHEEASQVLDRLIARAPKLRTFALRRNILLIDSARQLMWLARNDETRAIVERLLAEKATLGLAPHIHRLGAMNESYGGGDAARFEAHINALDNPRHHLKLTPFRSGTTAPTTRVAVILHLFYLEMWPELRGYLESLRGTNFQLFITVCRDFDYASVARDILAFDSTAQILPVENRGFDVGAHFKNLDRFDVRGYDLALVLQTKKNSHTRVGPAWRRDLLQALMGTPERWRDNLRVMAENPKVGMLGSGLHKNSLDLWTYREMRDVLRLLGMPTEFDEIKKCYEFIAGTMFLIRGNLLADIHAKLGHLRFYNFQSLSLRKRLDATYAHAIERVFGMYTRWRGYEILWRP